MDLADLVSGIRIVELTAKTRQGAIRALVQAANWDDDGINPENVLEAIEEREAAAQTLVANDFALPHAFIDWDGDFRIVLGRSKSRVDYGGPAGVNVQLIVLLVIGRRLQQTHVEVLAALAELLKSPDFRQNLIDAKDIKAIDLLLMTQAGIQPENRPVRGPSIPRLTVNMVKTAIQLTESLAAQALLLAVERVENVPWEALANYKGRLLLVTSQHSEEFDHKREDLHIFDVAHASLSRADRANLGLLLAASSGLLTEKQRGLCDRPRWSPARQHQCHQTGSPFSGDALRKNRRGADVVRPAVMLRVLTLAIEIAAEGREAHPIGALFVIGDSRQVLRHSQQLVLNPFHGYARQLRNVLDPSLAETMKEFALIDGAFIIQGDGTVLSAGTYLTPKSASGSVAHGLGARHQTAAAISAHTQAMAITVSQSTGTVTVFRNGSSVLSLERSGRTKW